MVKKRENISNNNRTYMSLVQSIHYIFTPSDLETGRLLTNNQLLNTGFIPKYSWIQRQQKYGKTVYSASVNNMRSAKQYFHNNNSMRNIQKFKGKQGKFVQWYSPNGYHLVERASGQKSIPQNRGLILSMVYIHSNDKLAMCIKQEIGISRKHKNGIGNVAHVGSKTAGRERYYGHSNILPYILMQSTSTTPRNFSKSLSKISEKQFNKLGDYGLAITKKNNKFYLKSNTVQAPIRNRSVHNWLRSINEYKQAKNQPINFSTLNNLNVGVCNGPNMRQMGVHLDKLKDVNIPVSGNVLQFANQMGYGVNEEYNFASIVYISIKRMGNGSFSLGNLSFIKPNESAQMIMYDIVYEHFYNVLNQMDRPIFNRLCEIGFFYGRFGYRMFSSHDEERVKATNLHRNIFYNTFN